MSIAALADVVHLQARPLPKATDGRYDHQVKAKTDPKSPHEQHSLLWRVEKRLAEDAKFFKVFSVDAIAPGALQALFNPGAIDDRTGLFTKALSYLCNLPEGSSIEKDLNDKVITLMYSTLEHPPATYLGTGAPVAAKTGSGVSTNGAANGSSLEAHAVPSRFPYAFRSADGSGNNPLIPDLGKAGTPYARSVQGKHTFAPNTLPDPGEVFDVLLKARDWKPHPGGNSSLTFAFASLVTHSLFRTDRSDNTINNASSYLDLSILYGINQAQQNLVRDRESGRGYLYPDSFAEDRLVLVPPAATALLVILSRNHNHICDMLLNINERGRWKDPPKLPPGAYEAQDEEIFQTARLINCGHFMSMIFGDYVAGFLGLGRDGNSWSMNPFDPIKLADKEQLGRGEGNHCSVEFNLLYRWHATAAKQDVKWTEDLFSNVFGTNNFASLSLKDVGPAIGKAWQKFVDPNPRTREFADIHRGPNGKFSDDDLARILQDSTESMAGSYRARGTPGVLRVIEMATIRQARSYGVCSMNEFRAFLGLKKFDDFEEWSSDKEIAQAARQLYGHIDNLELYPGLQAEDCMPLGPGSGICCGYTMTRAILADAICLVRGDRFYTTDYTPYNLTAWGYQDCARDPNNGAFGAALPKLLFRHLPRHYPANSVYALFPFFTPETTKKNLTNLKIADKYDFARPKPEPIPKVVDTLKGIRQVFTDNATFKTNYPDLVRLTGGRGFFLNYDSADQAKHERDAAWAWHSLLQDGDPKAMEGFVKFYKDLTRKLIKTKSYKINGLPGTRVDIVRNVINLLAVHWVSDYLFDIDLKTEDHPSGMFTEQEVYDMLMVIFTSVFLNVAPEHGWALRAGADQIIKIFNSLIEKSYREVVPANPLMGLLQSFGYFWKPKKPYHDLMARLAESNRTVHDVVSEVVGLACGSSMNFAQAIAQIVDFYLDPERAAEFAEIKTLVTKNDPVSNERLKGYAREAQRLNPQFTGVFRNVASNATIPLGNSKSDVKVQRGDVVFSSFYNAQMDPHDFPDPEAIDPTRPVGNYMLLGADGAHRCMGFDFVPNTVHEILRVIFSLKNLRRANGPAGRMAQFNVYNFGTKTKMYLDNNGNVSPWPGSLTVVYDE